MERESMEFDVVIVAGKMPYYLAITPAYGWKNHL